MIAWPAKWTSWRALPIASKSVDPSPIASGQAPSGLFLGNFDGSGTGIATLNAGSDTISLIGRGGVVQTIATGGLRPSSGFSGDFTGGGFADLVVGNAGDGRLSLLTGGPGGLSLSQVIASAAVRSPTALSFAGVSDGVLSFYAASAGREAASLLAFDLNDQGGAGALSGEGLAAGTGQSVGSVLAAATVGVFQQAAQLLGLRGSALDLIAPLFTVSVIPGELEGASTGGAGIALLANFLSGTGPAVGQGLTALPEEFSAGGEVTNEAQPPEEQAASEAADQEPDLPSWEWIAMGIDRAWEEIRTDLLQRRGGDHEAADRAVSTTGLTTPPGQVPERSSSRLDASGQSPRYEIPSKGQAAPPAVRTPDSSRSSRLTSDGVADAAIEDLMAEADARSHPRHESSGWWDAVAAAHYHRLTRPIAAEAVLASTATIAGWVRANQLRSRRAHKGSGYRSMVSAN